METSVSKIIKTIIVIILFLVYGLLTNIIAHAIGIDTSTLNQLQTNLLDLAFCIVFMIIIYFLYFKTVNHDIKDFFAKFKEYFKFGLKWWLIGLIIMVTSNIIITYFFHITATNEINVMNEVNIRPIYMLFSVVIYAPFVEELVFRKSLKDVFKNGFLYIVVCALLFAGIHILSSYDPAATFDKLQLLFAIPYGALGGIFGYIYYKKDNIFISIFFHALHNLIIVAFYIIKLTCGG